MKGLGVGYMGGAKIEETMRKKGEVEGSPTRRTSYILRVQDHHASFPPVACLHEAIEYWDGKTLGVSFQGSPQVSTPRPVVADPQGPLGKLC
jgi:hypothetical protein